MDSAKDLVEALIATAADYYRRGWMSGTSGNLSVRLTGAPWSLAITGSGADKGALALEDIVIIPETLRTKHSWLPPAGRFASAETAIHRAIYDGVPGVGAVLHVHTVASTVLSLATLSPGQERGLVEARGLEMLKGWGVAWRRGELSASIPVLANDPDMSVLADHFAQLLKGVPGVPCVLVAGHGITAWGSTLAEARTHLEIAEFVCQVLWTER